MTTRTTRPRSKSWQPSPQDIEKVMGTLRPLRQWGRQEPSSSFTPEWTDQERAEAACREYIASALREIAAPRPGAGEMRKKVAKLASELAKARNAAKELPPRLMSASIFLFTR